MPTFIITHLLLLFIPKMKILLKMLQNDFIFVLCVPIFCQRLTDVVLHGIMHKRKVYD